MAKLSATCGSPDVDSISPAHGRQSSNSTPNGLSVAATQRTPATGWRRPPSRGYESRPQRRHPRYGVPARTAGSLAAFALSQSPAWICEILAGSMWVRIARRICSPVSASTFFSRVSSQARVRL